MIVTKQVTGKRLIHAVCKADNTYKDYKKVVIPFENKTLKKSGKFRRFYDIREMGSIEFKTMKEDFKNGLKYRDRFNAFAVVVDQRWQRLVMVMSKVFFPDVEVRSFSSEDYKKSWTWINKAR